MAESLGKLMFITLGCAKNEVDTDRMRSRLIAAGYEEVDESVQADCRRERAGRLRAHQHLLVSGFRYRGERDRYA